VKDNIVTYTYNAFDENYYRIKASKPLPVGRVVRGKYSVPEPFDVAVANGSLITVNAGAGFDLAGVTQTSKQIAGAGFITNSANNATGILIVGGTSATDVTTNLASTFSGVMTDNILAQTSSRLLVTKVGIGSLTLSGNNTHSGATTIVAGSIVTTRPKAMRPQPIRCGTSAASPQ